MKWTELEKIIEEKIEVKYRTPICGTPLLMPYQILDLLDCLADKQTEKSK